MDKPSAETGTNASNVVPFQAKKRRQKTADHAVMCRSGHHKWVLQTQTQFDVKKGKLVSVYQCKHCKALKSSAK